MVVREACVQRRLSDFDLLVALLMTSMRTFFQIQQMKCIETEKKLKISENCHCQKIGFSEGDLNKGNLI